jgi:hypothetical protein
MEWGFIWLMLVLKIPIVMLLTLVWWAVHNADAPTTESDDDGGTKVDPDHPRSAPRGPRRRGPHGDLPLPSPPRVRTKARSRDGVAP